MVFSPYLLSMTIELGKWFYNTFLVVVSFDYCMNSGLLSLSSIDNNQHIHYLYHIWCGNCFYDTFLLDPSISKPIVSHSNPAVGFSDDSFIGPCSGSGFGQNINALWVCNFLLLCLHQWFDTTPIVAPTIPFCSYIMVY